MTSTDRSQINEKHVAMNSLNRCIFKFCIKILIILAFFDPKLKVRADNLTPTEIKWSSIIGDKEFGFNVNIQNVSQGEERGTLVVVIMKSDKSPTLYVRDLKVDVFDYNGRRIPITSIFPDEFPLLETGYAGGADAHALYKIQPDVSNLSLKINLQFHKKVYHFEIHK